MKRLAVAAGLRRARTLGRRLATITDGNPSTIRRRLLDSMMELVGADVACFYSLGMANGQRVVKSWEAVGDEIKTRCMDNLASPAAAVAMNDTGIRDYARPNHFERSAFVEDTALWESEDFLESVPYKVILEPYGLRHQQRLLAFHGLRFLGWVGLTRARGSKPFTVADRCQLQPLVQPAITALLTAERLERASQPEEAGDVVMNATGQVLHASSHGRAWLELPQFASKLFAAVRAHERVPNQPSSSTGVGSAHARIVRLDGPGGVRYLAHLSPLESLTLHPDAPLTPRQRQVAYSAAKGATVREIAVELGVSAETVRTHLRDVYRRLMVANRVELAQVLLPREQH